MAFRLSGSARSSAGRWSSHDRRTMLANSFDGGLGQRWRSILGPRVAIMSTIRCSARSPTTSRTKPGNFFQKFFWSSGSGAGVVVADGGWDYRARVAAYSIAPSGWSPGRGGLKRHVGLLNRPLGAAPRHARFTLRVYVAPLPPRHGRSPRPPSARLSGCSPRVALTVA